jgi:hypothetical protein
VISGVADQISERISSLGLFLKARRKPERTGSVLYDGFSTETLIFATKKLSINL